MTRRNPNEGRRLLRVDRRAVISSVLAAALYTAVSLLPNPIDLPGLHNLNFRPGVVVPVLAGILLGPIAGFAVGAAGTLVADGLTFGISWNWAIGNGLIGLIAGLVPAARLASRARWRSIGVATVISALAIILGIGFAALTDVLVANLTPDTAIGVEWISVAKWELVWGVPLTVIVLLARPRRPKITG
ncbi:MAG: hypothetical protein E6I16_08880 [Chloroflexi bacterium]|nr:MAG: hypothetical protein E6I16_08880 [Chloroflexota bacterium]